MGNVIKKICGNSVVLILIIANLCSNQAFSQPFLPGTGQASEHPASFVWKDTHGEGRNLHVMFRQNFTLENLPEKAELNLYADSRYILYVNGHAIHYGPARAYPANPVFDTCNLMPYLEPGPNTIAVMVRSNGTNTYQLPLSIGGFVAWGEITSGSYGISLNTPGNWKCLESKARLQEAPKMSFATGPMEIHDARKEPVGWQYPGFDDTAWTTPVPLDNQNHWGKLLPRNIPFLTQDEMLPKELIGKYILSRDEDIISFRIKTSDKTQRDFNTQKRVFAYTYIYSPTDQLVETGTWWGEYYLNGTGPLQRHPTPIEVINRERMQLDLKQGWNFFFIKYDVVWASWEFYMAFPKDAGLMFSPDKIFNDRVAFRSAGPFSDQEEHAVLALPLPFASPDQLTGFTVGWEDRLNGNHAGNPAWEIAWSRFGDELPYEPYEVSNIQIKEGMPTALLFDMRHKKLGRIFIEYDAPEGTRFDIGFSEDLINGRPWVLKRAGIFTAAGHTSGKGSTQFETFKPYGLRYLQVNVSGHQQDVTIKRIGVINQIYPFELAGSFTCSDPMMNDLWQLGWRTLLVCSEDSYTDTPFRERGLYAGDALPEYAITLATSGDSRLIKRSLEIFQDYYISLFKPNADPHEGTPAQVGDFPLKTLEFFRWYVQMSNDREFAERLYPRYQNLIDKYRALDNYEGLTIFPQVFIEWTQMHKQRAALTVANALLVRSYRNMAWLAAYLGRKTEEGSYSVLADVLTEKVLTLCWDEEKGAFHDGYYQGKKIESHYPIASAYAVLFGLTREHHDEKLKAFFAKELADIGSIERSGKSTPYGGYYIFGALYKLGEAATAERFMLKYWSPMILKHNDTAWENFSDSPEGRGQGTLSHAWSGSPTFYMSTQILGVPLMFPDFDTDDNPLVIAPQSDYLNWAKGTVPHPKGPVTVSWQVKGDYLFVDVKAPEQLEWTVKPTGRLGKLKLVLVR